MMAPSHINTQTCASFLLHLVYIMPFKSLHRWNQKMNRNLLSPSKKIFLHKIHLKIHDLMLSRMQALQVLEKLSSIFCSGQDVNRT